MQEICFNYRKIVSVPEPDAAATAAASPEVTTGLLCAREYAGTDRTIRLVPPTTVVMTTDFAEEVTHVVAEDWGAVAGAILIGTFSTDCPTTCQREEK